MTKSKEDIFINNQKKIVLEFFKKNNYRVHIRLIDGEDKGLFRNGIILQCNEDSFLILDDLIGSKTYKYSDVSQNIVKYKSPEEMNNEV